MKGYSPEQLEHLMAFAQNTGQADAAAALQPKAPQPKAPRNPPAPKVAAPVMMPEPTVGWHWSVLTGPCAWRRRMLVIGMVTPLVMWVLAYAHAVTSPDINWGILSYLAVQMICTIMVWFVHVTGR